MPAKKRPASSAVAARLAVLRSSDEHAYAAYARELLRDGDRLAREAALESLLEQPAPSLRADLRALYLALHADGLRRDQGSRMRAAIVRILTQAADRRDADIGVLAVDTSERVMGEDLAWQLRTYGLRMLAELAPETFAYYAAEHLDDRAWPHSEPANTAFQLLAATGHHALIYQWLIGGERDASFVAPAFELLAGAPAELSGRFVSRSIEGAIRRGDETLCTLLAEAVVEREIERSYPALRDLLAAKISDELYAYLAVLLAGTNRAPLLAILEEQLRRGRRPQAIADALRIRTTDEQAEILRRWEEGEPAAE